VHSSCDVVILTVQVCVEGTEAVEGEVGARAAIVPRLAGAGFSAAACFRVPSAIWAGPGSAARIGPAVSALGGRRPLLVTDARLVRAGLLTELLAGLAAAAEHVELFDEVVEEPTTDIVRAALDRYRASDADVVVGVGGGSAIDTAKAVAVMADHPGSIADYEGRDRLGPRRRGLIAVPTTAGTGSEVTRVTVVTDRTRQVKMMLAADALMPDVAVVDPDLTHACPPAVTASAGLDALTHAIEAYLSRRATPLTDGLARAAAASIAAGLPRAWRDGTDAEARTLVMMGQLQAGMAFSNASVALVHGMSRPLGALFGVPHGIANAMLLAVVLRFTLPGAVERLAELAGPLGVDERALPAGAGAEARAAAAVDRVTALVSELGVPSLGAYGLPAQTFEASLPKMAADALASGSPMENPVVPDADAIVALYRQAWAGDRTAAGPLA
jgi:alcohol dehydrogenase